MKTLGVVCAVILLVGIIGCVTIIPPRDMTHTSIGETVVRIHIYMTQQRDYPKDLSVLPVRAGYANRTTDGWGRDLIYTVDEDGVITLVSLGRDGKPGGSGLDQDIVQKHRTRDTDGKLNIDDDLWLVTSEIRPEDPKHVDP